MINKDQFKMVIMSLYGVTKVNVLRIYLAVYLFTCLVIVNSAAVNIGDMLYLLCYI